MERWGRIVVLGGWLLPAVGIAAPAKDAAADSAEAAASSSQVPNLLVWVEPGVPDGERVGGWVEERGAVVLREHQPPLEQEDLVRVAVRGGPYDYEIHIALLRRKRLLEEQLDVIVCECGSDEMLQRVGEAIDEGARRLTDVAEQERAEAVREVESEPVKVEPIDGRRPRKLGAMGYAGIGVGVLGVGLVAAGIPLSLRPDEIRGGPGSTSTYTTRPPGIGLAAGGGAALAAGITLVVVDVVRRRKSRVAVVPAVGRGQTALSIAGRF